MRQQDRSRRLELRLEGGEVHAPGRREVRTGHRGADDSHPGPDSPTQRRSRETLTRRGLACEWDPQDRPPFSMTCPILCSLRAPPAQPPNHRLIAAPGRPEHPAFEVLPMPSPCLSRRIASDFMSLQRHQRGFPGAAVLAAHSTARGRDPGVTWFLQALIPTP